MALNEAKGNMYSWITHTWNTVKGECPHGCTYCYMKRWGKQKPVRFDYSELKTELGTGNHIFVGSSCDLFASGIPTEWIHNTLQHCNIYDTNDYLFQSKNPANFSYIRQHQLPIYKLCTTIETNRYYPKYMQQSPIPDERAIALSKYVLDWKYVTIEPIMDFDLIHLVTLIKLIDPVQVNIGADSGNNHLPEPSKEKLLALIDALKEFTIIDKKTNLNRILNTK
jgi:protein gp37